MIQFTGNFLVLWWDVSAAQPDFFSHIPLQCIGNSFFILLVYFLLSFLDALNQLGLYICDNWEWSFWHWDAWRRHQDPSVRWNIPLVYLAQGHCRPLGPYNPSTITVSTKLAHNIRSPKTAFDAQRKVVGPQFWPHFQRRKSLQERLFVPNAKKLFGVIRVFATAVNTMWNNHILNLVHFVPQGCPFGNLTLQGFPIHHADS